MAKENKALELNQTGPLLVYLQATSPLIANEYISWSITLMVALNEARLVISGDK